MAEKEKKEEDIFDFGDDEMAKDLFNDPDTEPKSFWFKFEKPGDLISGTLMMAPFDKEGKFGMQKIYVIQKANGEEWNVALKHDSNKRQIQGLNDAMPGDILAFYFKDEFDTDYGNKGKNIVVRIRKMDKK